MTKDEVTPEMIEAVETEVGMGHPAWDCVDPRAIIAAAFNATNRGS